MASQLRLAVLAASDQLFGLELEHLAVDSCTTTAPCGGQTVGPSPVDRHKQGLKRSVAVEASGLRWLPCRPSQPPRRWAAGGDLGRPGGGQAAATQPVVHLDAGYDDHPAGRSWPSARWWARSPPGAFRPRSWWAVDG